MFHFFVPPKKIVDIFFARYFAFFPRQFFPSLLQRTTPWIFFVDFTYFAKSFAMTNLLKQVGEIWWPHSWMSKNLSNTGSKIIAKMGFSLFLWTTSKEFKVFQAFVASLNNFFSCWFSYFCFLVILLLTTRVLYFL